MTIQTQGSTTSTLPFNEGLSSEDWLENSTEILSEKTFLKNFYLPVWKTTQVTGSPLKTVINQHQTEVAIPIVMKVLEITVKILPTITNSVSMILTTLISFLSVKNPRRCTNLSTKRFPSFISILTRIMSSKTVTKLMNWMKWVKMKRTIFQMRSKSKMIGRYALNMRRASKNKWWSWHKHIWSLPEVLIAISIRYRSMC